MDSKIQDTEFYYDVFLSYRHKPRDNKISRKVHTLLETFKPPRRFKQADIRRVFRDNEELPVAGVLSDTIGEALVKARILLVICSTDTPQSQWVDREVRTFIELGKSDRIYALLIGGTPETSFPPSLHLVPGIHDRILTMSGNTEPHRLRRLKKELLKVIAAATGTPFEHLNISLKRRKLLRSIFAGLALSVFLFASGIYSLYQWSKAAYYNLYAKREELVIQDVIHSISADLTLAVDSMDGASPALIRILSDNILYIDRIMDFGSVSPETLREKGNNYLSLSRAYMLNGDNEKSSDTAKKAADIFEQLVVKEGISYSRDLAICYNLSGLYMQSMTQYDDAIDYLDKAVSVYEKLEESEDGEDSAGSRADCLNSIAVCHYLKGDYEKAANVFIQEISLRRKILGKEVSPENQKSIADLTSSVGSCLVSAGKYKQAEQYNYQAMELYKSIFEGSSSPQHHKAYAAALYSLGTNLAFLKDDENGEDYLRLSLVESDRLIAELPEFEPTYLCMYAMYDLLYAEEAKKQEALDASNTAYQISPDDTFIHHVYAFSLLYNGYYDEALQELESLIDRGSSTPKSILADIELFTLRGRSTEDLKRLKEHLEEK